ncbi:uncharacterized protein CBL_03616 [Carabus blaptoides fortunei]
MYVNQLSGLLVLVTLYGETIGHGMVMDPPNRASLWRFDPGSPINYDDNANFCGGRAVQWENNGGNCGICGDDYRIAQPRPNENGGTFGRGTVAKTYQQGEVIQVNVLLTANHMGWFKFSLCNLTDPDTYETEDCFDELKLADGNEIYKLPSSDTGYYAVDIQLPVHYTCERCVLRWHYNTGNSWGICPDGTGALGCGPQENFRTCSDISIE